MVISKDKKQILERILLMTVFSLSGALLSLALAPHLAFASGFVPLPSISGLDIAAPEGDTAIQKLESFLGPVARNARIIVGALAVLFIVIAGFSMVIVGDNEEGVKEKRKVITYSVIGLMMISIAGPVAEVFDYRNGNFMSDPEQFVERSQLFSSATLLVITFLKYLLGSLATLMLIRSGAILVMSSDNEEEVTREKKNILYIAAGLFLVVVSSLVVNKIFYNVEFNDAANTTRITLDQNELMRQIIGVVNLMVSFVGPIMMLGLVASGVLYLTSAGNDERMGLAKKIMVNSVIGIVVIYGAFALVSTVISGYF
ncbi:MAG: pilin [Candidatus Gracilibacteria bacterium]|jgi:hypothetical protein